MGVTTEQLPVDSRPLAGASPMQARRAEPRVREVAEHGYWSGFFSCLKGQESDKPALCYGSTSGLYQYNGVREAAYSHGVRACLAMLEKRDADKFPGTVWGLPPVPDEVYADAYAAAGLSAAPRARWRLRFRRPWSWSNEQLA